MKGNVWFRKAWNIFVSLIGAGLIVAMALIASVLFAAIGEKAVAEMITTVGMILSIVTLVISFSILEISYYIKSNKTGEV